MQRHLLHLTVLLSGLIAGFFFAFSADVNLATAELGSTDYTRIQQLINLKVRNPVFAVVYFGAVLAPALMLVLSWRSRRTAAFRWSLFAFLLYFIGAFLVTREINIPINNAMALWDPLQAPADWAVLRDKWNMAHLFRTIVAIVSFACYLPVLCKDK